MNKDGFPFRLVVLRHGQSEWNAAGLFAGWEDAHLTTQGELQAARAGSLLAEHGLLPDFVHTSLQRRTIRTAGLVLAAVDRDWIPVRRSWRLNGRHYGALQGRNKAEVLEQYGERQFTLWRRSYDVPPPPLDEAAMSSQAADPRYRALPPDALPRAESLADVSARLLPYWYDTIVPRPALRRMRARRLARQHAAGGWSSTLSPSRMTGSPEWRSPPASRWSTSSRLICTRMRWAVSTSARAPPAAAWRPSPCRHRTDPEEVHHEDQARR